MTQPVLHPRADRVWRRPLVELLPVLTRELERRPVGTWAWRALPKEAVVAVRRDSSQRRTLRIARQRRPEPRFLAAWAREVQTFLIHLGCTEWRSIPAESCAGIEARWLEVFPGESSSATARGPVGQAAAPLHTPHGADRSEACAPLRKESQA